MRNEMAVCQTATRLQPCRGIVLQSRAHANMPTHGILCALRCEQGPSQGVLWSVGDLRGVPRHGSDRLRGACRVARRPLPECWRAGACSQLLSHTDSGKVPAACCRCMSLNALDVDLSFQM